MTNKEYFKKLDKIYKWYDRAKKAYYNQSGEMQLYLLQEKNQMIAKLQQERIK
jgi:hypothetical protein